MRVLHTISSLGVSSGGPSQSTYYTVLGLKSKAVDVSVITYQSSEHDRSISDDDFIIALPKPNSKIAYSSAFKNAVNDFDCDIYHAQAIWQYPTHITAKVANKKNKAYLISPRGMLYPTALNYSKWMKKIFMTLWFRKDLQQASCIHATCIQEMIHIRDLGFTNPVAVIPNPVVVNKQQSESGSQKQIGFVGRLHTIKNVEVLINAFNRANHRDYKLMIIGDGDPVYVQSLKGISGADIVFSGFLDGKQKEEAISNLSYLILPSHSENFGMVVAESLVKGIPVIASKGTPWEDLETYNCGWWVDNDSETLVSAIEKAINTPEDIRKEMGRRGQQLILDTYSIDVVSEKMEKLYEWILNGGSKPDFVYL